MPGAVAVPPGPDTVEALAVGIELKFLLLGLPRDHVALTRDSPSLSHPHPHPHQVAYAALARAVENGKVPVGSSHSGLAMQPLAISRDDIAAAGRQESEYWPAYWIIKKANSVEHGAGDPAPDSRRTNGVVVPVEVNSPKLSWVDPCAPTLVREVVARLTTTFPVVANHTCDFHVHVGRLDGASFALPTLQKLATVFWLAEPLLRSVRNPQSPNFANDYTWGFEQRRYSRLALALDRQPRLPDDGIDISSLLDSGGEDREHGKDGKGREKRDSWMLYMSGVGSAARRQPALRAIWRAATARELGWLLSGPQREYRRLGFNFSAFGEEDQRARTNPRTIEFRILEGTLQSELLLGWLTICGKLVELGMKGRQTHFRDVVRYLLAQQPIYEDLRICDYRVSRFSTWHFDVGSVPGVSGAAAAAAERPTRDVLFGELMERVGVPPSCYVPFQTKIREAYGAA